MKAILSALVGVILLSFSASGPAFAQASTPPTGTEAKSERELNRGLNAGKACLDYKLEIPSLVDNDHRMFWKPGDCIRVYVTNNPFLFKYNLEFNEQLIKEDDPLSAFGGKFGLNVSTVSNAGSGVTSHNTANDEKDNASAVTASINDAAKKANSEIAELPVSPDAKGFLSLQVENFSKDLATPETSASSKKKLNYYKQQVDNANIQPAQKEMGKKALEDVANAAKPGTPPPPEDVTVLTESDKRIQHMLALITDEYRKFSRDVQGRLSVLIDPATPLDKVQSVAIKLRADSNQEVDCLSAGNFDDKYTKLLGCPENINSESLAANTSQPANTGIDCMNPASHTFVCQLLEFAHEVQPLHEKIEPALSDKSASTSALMDDLHGSAQDVALQACTYQAFSDSDVSSIRTGLLAPLNSVLSDGFAFGYQYPNASKKREGPFADPTSVTMTLQRDPISPFTGEGGASKILEYTSSSFTCSGDPEDLVTNGSSYRTLADFFSDKPVKPAKVPASSAGTAAPTTVNLYMRNQNKPVPNGKTTSTSAGQGPDSTGRKSAGATKTSTSDAASTTVLVQPWLFGKPRLVLSGGVGTALLSKQEFQRSMSISGGTTETVVGLKTNTKARTTPMLYGHTFLPWLDRRHDPDAWYATFGVTANSDNKGTDPEFLFGLSRSFVQQRFFVTAGAYLGERQKLDGGLYVGEVIPSTFTTDLPVTKSYHTGFAFGISYRFTSTKPGQDNAKQPNGGSSKKGN
ncbi:MAG: hypothetical protein ACLP56_20570 [Candidatus Sulfotelmatobacter sp.]